ncbi:MAG: DHHA1 domain-containing protein [bacterium]|nr:DHHA1 domain-containing protein [bacterium]
MIQSLAQEILAKVQSARLVGIVFHRHPDADSLGAGAAFAALLDAYKIPYRYYCPTDFPETAPIFGIDPSQTFHTKEIAEAGLDLVCTFDAADAKMAGLEFLEKGANNESISNLRISNSEIRKFGFHSQLAPPFIVNFDHHATNTQFGNINVVDVGCASTTELIYHFFSALRFPISSRVAVFLLAGILHDTDYFLNPATSASSLSMAGELLRRGISLSSLRALLFERRGIGSLQLIGEVLGRLRKNARYGIAITYVKEDDLEKHNATADDIEGIANILNVVGDAKVMCVIKEEAGIIKGSFRTTREDIDVGRLAEFFGGGGHRKASGFRIRGALQIEGNNVRVI